MWSETAKTRADLTTPKPPSIDTLVLRGVHTTARAIILDLGPLWFGLQYLTHTSPQFYTRCEWKDLCKLTNKERGYHVGVAFAFESFVLCFNTQDLVFQPSWALTRADLPYCEGNVLEHYGLFKEGIAEWVMSRAHCPRNGLATVALRIAGKYWWGTGAYTVNEAFKTAGVSPLLPEREVADSFLCTRSYPTNHFGEPVLKAAIRDGKLAPTQGQRESYKDMLHVHGKDHVAIAERTRILCEDYEAAMESFTLRGEMTWSLREEKVYDVFEPTDIAIALQREGNLGHLIFGRQTWATMVKPSLVSDGNDPLTRMYAERGLLDEPTHLRPNFYKPVFLNREETKTTWVATKAYYANKQIWSLTSLIPSNCIECSSAYKVSDERRKATLFQSLIRSKRVAIGPYEYCGNAQVIRKQGGGGKM
ncbi:hypothetical protein BD410DRAFT_734246 [Rickenella mellea]|uniref:Uncharacterized protein n=1 Tax=Rickenella mellea TaxID=50990 RepID=A0A4Y7PGP6_9AGAM|nr:hypothetical protein BD410DRAFT_734246 [Rickenella mellea]